MLSEADATRRESGVHRAAKGVCDDDRRRVELLTDLPAHSHGAERQAGHASEIMRTHEMTASRDSAVSSVTGMPAEAKAARLPLDGIAHGLPESEPDGAKNRRSRIPVDARRRIVTIRPALHP